MTPTRHATRIPTRLRTVIRLLLLGALLTGSQACTPKKRPLSEPLGVSPADIMPMHDRDHYVYLWQRVTSGDVDDEGYHVEHVTILPDEHQYEITVSEDGSPAGRLRFFHDGKRVELLSEDDLENGIRRSYDPPLVHLRAPLRAGESGSRSTASITHIDTGQLIARVGVSQRVRLSRANDIESVLGHFEEAVLMESRRTLHTPTGDVEMLSAMVLVPGVGEVRSEGATITGEVMLPGEAPAIDTVLRRELACAIVDNRPVGNCRNVEDRLHRLVRPVR
jgi:hypothetical protein